MTQIQLPAHLQGRQVNSLTERAAEGMGSTLPPHISIQGNSFTFIDAAGNEYQPMLTFDAVVVDVSDHMNKRYYDKPYDPNAQTYEPPACWSANGIGPSKEAPNPQSPTCNGCPMNDRGSAVSRISGAAIKACRDETWIAILVPAMPQYIFQLVITPGSFKNWKAYIETLKNFGCELSLTVTRFSFQPKVNGVILFERVDWVGADTIGFVEAAVKEKKTNLIVGRTDQPRAALPAPAAIPQLAAPLQNIATLPQDVAPQPTFVSSQTAVAAGAGQALAPFVQTAPVAAPAGTGAVSATPEASPSEPARRRRRTQAEIAAANARPGVTAHGIAPTPAPFVPASTVQAAPQAPFPVANQAPAAAPAAQFGMPAAGTVNPEMAAMLAQMDFVKQG